MTWQPEDWEQEYWDLPMRKCRKCGRINTHRIVDGHFVCNGEPADESTWEDIGGEENSEA